MTPDHDMRGTVSRSVIYVARAGAESLYMMRVVPLVNAVAGSANAGLGAERWADGRTRRKAGACCPLQEDNGGKGVKSYLQHIRMDSHGFAMNSHEFA